jgi:hypothetical protein
MKLDRIISIATLVVAVVAIVVVLKRPAPVSPTVIVAPAASSAQAPTPAQPSSDNSKPTAGTTSSAPQIASAAPISGTPAPTAGKAESQVSPDAISAMVAKTLAGQSSGPLTPDSNMGGGEPNIKDQQVTMDGDIVHGRFLTEIGGKDVWVTVSGHMGEKDGYATFDPTEFKVGDTEVPVALVNPLLQQKMAEQRDKLKVSSSPQ